MDKDARDLFDRLNPVAPPPASPEPMPEECEYIEVHCPHCETMLSVDLDELRAGLKAHGLHIVDESSAKVFKHSLAWLRSDNLVDLAKNEGMMVLALRGCEAELARREKEKRNA